jgi:hypothetical protein
MSFLIGLLAGVFGGLVGLGGGVVMVPMMTGWLKLSQRQAQGTSLVALVFTGLSGGVAYGMNQSVDWLAAVLLAVPAMATAWWGAKYCDTLSERKLKRVFGIFLIVIAGFLLLKPCLHPLSGVTVFGVKVAVLVGTGLFTGFLSGFLGIGGGAILIATMVLVLGYGQHMAQGSSLLAMVPVAVVGALIYRRLGNISASPLKGIVPGILVGAYAGAQLANFFPETGLRYIFAIVLIGTGLRSLMTKRGEEEEACG